MLIEFLITKCVSLQASVGARHAWPLRRPARNESHHLAIICLPFLFFLVSGLGETYVYAQAEKESWQELRDKHFVIYYQAKEDQELGKILLRRAEEYYQKIGSQIGYTRYTNFWTWEERAKILVFRDQKAFVESTGQPPWATGYADRDSYLFKSRAIVTYKQEKEFVDGLLPHEISHLILYDFISQKPIPIWFDEGVAQLQEAAKSKVADNIMRTLVKNGQYIPFDAFTDLDIRREKDTKKVQIFYAQSLSVVEFLLGTYGNDAFSRLCHNLRNGKSFAEALTAAYTNTILSIEDLEHKWVRYMSQ